MMARRLLAGVLPKLATLAILVLALLLLPRADSASAGSGSAATGTELITINVTAQVGLVSDLDNVLGGAISVGDIISGTYTYDPTVPDSSGFTTVGEYWHVSPPYGIRVFAGGFVFETDPSDVNFLVEITNDHTRTPRDNYLLRSYNNLPLSNGMTVEHISWQLNDDTAAALTSASLPKVPPNLSDWDSVAGLTLRGENPNDSSVRGYIVRAHVTFVELASQPAQPDLVIESIGDAQQPFTDCTTPAGVKVTIRNVGDGSAGPSTTRISSSSGSQSVATPAIAPGQATTVFSTLTGIPFNDTYTAVADYTDTVDESDEANNTLVDSFSLGTLPTCTPLPTVTPTPSPTPTPTPSPPPAVGGVSGDSELRTLPLEEATTNSGVGSTAQWLAVTLLALLVVFGGVALRRQRR